MPLGDELLPEPMPAELRRARLHGFGEARPGKHLALLGRVKSIEAPLTSPMQGLSCAAYDLLVHGTGFGPGTDPGPVVLLHRNLRAVSFTLEDDNGHEAVVDPRGAFVRLAVDKTISPLNRWHMTDREAVAKLEDLGPLAGAEGVLLPGARVVVVGRVELSSREGGAYRRTADTRLLIAGGGDQPSMVSNRDGDIAAFRDR